MSIVRRKPEVPVDFKQMFGGAGEAEMHKILVGAEEMMGKGRLFNHMFLKPGAEVGWHVHKGDCETYYILKGKGEYSDNGKMIEVFPGDMTFVGDGEGHSIKAVGDETLEFIALILYTT